MSKFSSSCSFEKVIGQSKHQTVDSLLDSWHKAAANSDLREFFGCFHNKNSRFLGTDSSENWTAQEAYTLFKPHFEKNNSAWVYEPIKGSRRFDIIQIGTVAVAMFDELLTSQSFLCKTRGNGTLILDNGCWYIGQYYLSFPIPNPMAKTMCKSIADFEATNNELNKEDKQKQKI